jgi:hypothetical protein
MKGIIFTELLEMIEKRWTPELADRVLRKSALASGGAYTSVARYPASEWQSIVANLANQTGVPGPRLVREFGEYLFGSFKVLYPRLLNSITDSFSLFEAVDSYIHVEVKKLHPDAQLPVFQCTRSADGVFVMKYSSPRPMADLAEGLIHGTLKHFGEDISVMREDTPGGPPYLSRFTMRRNA